MAGLGKLIKNAAILVAALGFLFVASSASAYTANKVWFEFRPNGLYRVYVNYTVPELKSYRQAYIEFKTRKKAEKFYWDAVRGADFYLNDPEKRRFVQTATEPEPW